MLLSQMSRFIEKLVRFVIYRGRFLYGLVGLCAIVLGLYLSHNISRIDMSQDILANAELVTLDGSKTKFADWQSEKLLIVNFWATWCSPCILEIPVLIAIQREYFSNVQILGIALDKPESVRVFALKNKFNYPLAVGIENGLRLSKLLGDESGMLPVTIFLTSGKEVVHTHIGPLTKEKLVYLIKKHIKI